MVGEEGEWGEATIELNTFPQKCFEMKGFD